MRLQCPAPRDVLPFFLETAAAGGPGAAAAPSRRLLQVAQSLQARRVGPGPGPTGPTDSNGLIAQFHFNFNLFNEVPPARGGPGASESQQ